MGTDNVTVAAKLRRWEKYLNNYRLPSWEEIPDIGLYMEQVITLLKQYLDYLPPELKEEQFITAATINNYVRKHVMPMPVKKKYYREHLAYLIMICSLKQGLSISLIQRLIPIDISENQIKEIYTRYTGQHHIIVGHFAQEVRSMAAPILEHDEPSDINADNVYDLVTASAVIGSFSRLLAEKLLLLEGVSVDEEGNTIS